VHLEAVVKDSMPEFMGCRKTANRKRLLRRNVNAHRGPIYQSRDLEVRLPMRELAERLARVVVEPEHAQGDRRVEELGGVGGNAIRPKLMASLPDVYLQVSRSLLD